MFQTFCTDILEPSIASTAVSQRSEDRSGEFDLLPVFLGRRLRTRNSNFPAGFPRFLACLLSLRLPKYEVRISSMIFCLSLIEVYAGVCGCSDTFHRRTPAAPQNFRYAHGRADVRKKDGCRNDRRMC